ncbi:Glycerate 3-kinase [Emticicia aquatica]|uniref:Glycerate 3-kinase n=1 Tax=Emticicia aquatica TaxID=1681835 RepID=A0ABN8EXC3_9BACT|nr:glycerate kinase [Emticicia aquatica]CAH0997747.1 Glycerate 3-kinase [Emticicia aquatica]
MNILIAPDKFKDAASAIDVCIALKKGILNTFPSAKCSLLPLADGGEGTLESIAMVLGADWKYIEVLDPLFRPVSACYLYIPEKKIAIIEMARASGIELLTPKERNCLITSSYGTGILIKDAIKIGAEEIVITVGGTATNDAGIGIASALGFRFFDKNNQELPPIGENLIKIDKIDDNNVLEKIKTIKFIIATDVENPFYGNKGAAFVFARQKGADDAAIIDLNSGLFSFAKLLDKFSNINPQDIAGSGAGGGVGGGLACLFNAQIISAAEWILTLNNVSEVITENQILITGEGKVDSQTWDGKLISKLLQMADNAKVPVMIICGTLQDIDILALQNNIIYANSILNKPMTLDDALTNTNTLIEQQGILLGKLLSTLSL